MATSFRSLRSLRPLRSLRARIGLRIAAGTAVILLFSGLVIDRGIEARLLLDFDRSLLARARALATLTELEVGRGYNLEFADEVMPEFSRRSAPDFFQVWVESGRVLERSRSLGEGDLPRERTAGEQPRFSDAVLPDGRPGRLVQLDYVPQIDQLEGQFENSHASETQPLLAARTATVVVATGREPFETSLAEVRRVTALTLGALALLLAGIGFWAVAAGLAPLTTIGKQVAAIQPETLGRRVEPSSVPSEVAPLAAKLNDLLERMERALERERRLSRDLAHELRTPVAELRTLSEVSARWPEDPETRRAFAADAHAIALGMERVISALLSLARAEAGTERVHNDSIEIGAVIESACRRVAAESRERAVLLVLDLPGDLTVACDAARVELILGNLIENAVLHSVTGSEVRITARGTGIGSAIVEIANPAPNLSAEDLPHLFERFWRKDPAHRSGGHAGLGLPLAAALARSLGAELAPSLEADGRLVMRLALPPAG